MFFVPSQFPRTGQCRKLVSEKRYSRKPAAPRSARGRPTTGQEGPPSIMWKLAPVLVRGCLGDRTGAIGGFREPSF